MMTAQQQQLAELLAGVNAGAQEKATAEAPASSSAAAAVRHADTAISTTPPNDNLWPAIHITGAIPTHARCRSQVPLLGRRSNRMVCSAKGRAGNGAAL